MTIESKREEIEGNLSGRSLDTPPFITVAICTRNRAHFLPQAVNSVLCQMQPEVELLIVDNSSTDETPTLLRKLCQENCFVRVHVEQELGLSYARNAALRNAFGKYVLFLDDDDIAEDGWLATYVQFFRNLPNSNIGGAGGAVVSWFDCPIPAWLPAGSYTLNWSDTAQPFKTTGGPWNGNLALDRQIALSVGGYDPRFGRHGVSMASHEDSALFEVIQSAGYQFWWLPQARIRYRIPRERLKFSIISRSEFAAGRSSAGLKASIRPAGFQRWAWSVGRLGAVPWQILGGALAATLLLCCKPLSCAASVWFRVCRNAGFAAELFALLLSKNKKSSLSAKPVIVR